MAVNIKAARQQLASILDTDLVTTAALVEEAFRYRVGDFAGKSPITALTTGAVDNADTFSSQYATICAGDFMAVVFNLYIFVLYAEVGAGVWDEENAEDSMDDITKEVIDSIHTIQSATYADWDNLEMANASPESEVLKLGGTHYLRRIISIRVSK